LVALQPFKTQNYFGEIMKNLQRTPKHLILALGLLSSGLLCATLTQAVETQESSSSARAVDQVSLPKEIELDRLMMAAQKYMEENQYSKATEYLERAESLKAKLPAEYHYYKGLVFKTQSQWNKSTAELQQYVIKAGKKGEFYQPALMIITEIENYAPNESQVDTNAEPAIQWENKVTQQSDDEYLAEIKKLYLSKSNVEALVEHINSLLVTAPYTGERVVKLSKGKDQLEYTLKLTDDNKLNIQKKQNVSGNAQILSYTTPVYGLSRNIVTICEPTQFKCSIKHKDNHTTWFEIAYNEDVAGQVSQATSLLIKEMQTNSVK